MTQPSEPQAAAKSKSSQTASKSKSKAKPKAKPPINTLDRWFKPSSGVAATKKLIEEPKEATAAATKEEKTPEKKKKETSKKFVQRYIHLTDECRVCENAKADETTRCELRCVTCSMTVHKKCYEVKGELPDGDWNCRRCQFIYDETSWEDISALVGVASPEGVTFPTCKPLDDTHKLRILQENADFATVFLFLQRFRRLGLKLSNVVTTLESLANMLLEPKEDGLCEELHTRLLVNVNVVMSKKYGWYVHLLRFLRDAEYPSAIGKDTKFPASSSEAEKREEFYFELTVAERVAILKFLCEIQFDRNDSLIELIDNEEAESMRNEPIGIDAAGRSYFVLEDAATVPKAALWVCRCAKVGGSDWETVCNDLESVESLVDELELSIDSSDLQLWQSLSRGPLKKLTRQLEKRKRNERWKSDLSANQVLDSSVDYGTGRRSLRNRQQVNYATIDAEGDEEEVVPDSDDEGDDEDAFETKSGDEADSETDGEGDEDDGEEHPRRSSRNVAVAKKRKTQGGPTHNSKRIRHSPHEDSTERSDLRRSTRTRSNVVTTTSSQDEESDVSDSDEN